MTDTKPVNFTIVPDDEEQTPRTYANFCAIQNSPLDFTLTFCEVLPLGTRAMDSARQKGIVRAPVRARLAVPVQMVPGLIAALQENFRLFQESQSPTPKGPMN